MIFSVKITIQKINVCGDMFQPCKRWISKSFYPQFNQEPKQNVFEICEEKKREHIIHIFYFFGDLKQDKFCLISLKNTQTS